MFPNILKKHSRWSQKEIKIEEVIYYVYMLDEQIIDSVRECFVAVDVETTGLRPGEDRIIELGAVKFEYGIATKKFESLIKADRPISNEASRINHITENVICNAPTEDEVCKEFIDFLGDAMKGKIFVCAHNANFDMMFITDMFRRRGYAGDIYCLDTLSLSRKIVKGLINYKLNSMAQYFHIINEREHRALADAGVCGNILINLIYEMQDPNQLVYEKVKNNQLDEKEMEIAQCIKKLINKAERTSVLKTRRKKGNLIELNCYYGFLEFYASKEKTYIVIPKSLGTELRLQTEPANKAEGEANRRYILHSLSDIDLIKDYIIENYKKAYHNMEEYIGRSEHRKAFVTWKMKLYGNI